MLPDILSVRFVPEDGCSKERGRVCESVEVLINGYPFRVLAVDGNSKKMNPDKEHYNLGLTEYIQPTINIRKGMDRMVTRSTVIHELTHAFIFAFGYGCSCEEEMCDFFASQADAIMKLTDEIMKGVNFDADRAGNNESD